MDSRNRDGWPVSTIGGDPRERARAILAHCTDRLFEVCLFVPYISIRQYDILEDNTINKKTVTIFVGGVVATHACEGGLSFATTRSRGGERQKRSRHSSLLGERRGDREERG